MNLLRILVLTKRQYMAKDLIDDRFGRFREIPLALAYKGHQVRGLCLSYAPRTEGWLRDGPVWWKSINATPLKLPGLLRLMFDAMKLAKQSDIIWACSDSFYGVIGCALSKLYRVPVIFDIYDNFGEFYVAQLPLARQLYHWAIRNSDAVTCLSKPFVRYISQKFKRQTKVYPLEFAVRHDLFKPLDKVKCRKDLGLPLNVQIVGTAGAINTLREVHLLFEAFNRLKDQYAHLHLAIAGPKDGNIQIPKDQKIHDLEILPFEKVPLLINALDVAVICYADDDYGKYCFPQKTREFMACNVPVIAAGVGSLKEIFKKHPEWLYKPGDVRSLVEVLKQRMVDGRTDYHPTPTWQNLADDLEKVILAIRK